MDAVDHILEELLDGLRESPLDEHLWKRLYETLWPYLFAFVAKQGRFPRHVTEELVQDVFLAIAKRQPFAELSGARALRAYFWTTARRRVMNQARSNARRPPPDPLESDPVDSLQGGEEYLAVSSWLRGRLAKLGDTDQSALALAVQGHSASEIADAVGSTAGAVRTRLSRVRARLRDEIEP